MRLLVAGALWVVIAAAGCDARATANTTGGEPVPITDRRSQELESCSSSQNCAESLRCVAQVCRAASGSVLGELYSAAGDAAAARGEVDRAGELYAEAVKRYEKDGRPTPVELYCAQGRALVGQRADKQRAELAARVLHRCLLGTPPGHAARHAALQDLALLLDLGLDPSALERSTPADAYLVKAAPRPDADALKVTVIGDPKQRSRAYTGFVEVLQGEPVRKKLVPCWEEYWKASRQARLEVALPFRYRPRLDEYDDFQRGLLTIDVLPAAGDAASQAAQGCVRDALTAIADDYAKSGPDATWSATITVVVGAGGN